MGQTIACDVSYYQRKVTDAYPHEWFIFRSNDGTFRDPNYAANLRWAKAAVESGKITGFTVYIVFRPGAATLATLKDMTGRPHRGMTVMIDVESWGGQIRGNHSKAITALADDLADWLGDRRRVLAYANRGDFGNLYPRRPDWLKLVLASYGGSRPHIDNMIGWQYTNGVYSVPGLPRSSKPFGRCDHNVFPNHSPKQLAAALGVGDDDPRPDDGTLLEELMKLDRNDPAYRQFLKDVAAETTRSVWTTRMSRSGSAWDHVTKAHGYAQQAATSAAGVKSLLTAKGGLVTRVAAVQAAIAALPTKTGPGGTVQIDAKAVADTVVVEIKNLLRKVSV